MTPDHKLPECHTMVLFKCRGKVRAGYWTGYDWDCPYADRLFQPHEVDQWWPLPTEEQLNAIDAIESTEYRGPIGHKGPIVGSMGPFLVGMEWEDTDALH